MRNIISLFFLFSFFGKAHAKPLYASCKGADMTFDFIGEGNGYGHVQINSGRLTIATKEAVTLAPTDGLMANSVSSFVLGSTAYNGTLEIHDSGNLTLSDPGGFAETASCTSNLFEGKIVQANIESPLTTATCGKLMFGYELGRLQEEADGDASKQCGEPLDQGRNVARIEQVLFEGYKVELNCQNGETSARVTSQYRCL
jgi:hypothetical protein